MQIFNLNEKEFHKFIIRFYKYIIYKLLRNVIKRISKLNIWKLKKETIHNNFIKNSLLKLIEFIVVTVFLPFLEKHSVEQRRNKQISSFDIDPSRTWTNRLQINLVIYEHSASTLET